MPSAIVTVCAVLPSYITVVPPMRIVSAFGFGSAAGASLLYSLRTEGGLFEVRFTMDGLYTAQVRADAAEQALQILAVLAAQSPESGGQNLSAAEKLCIMGRGLNRG